VGELTFFQQNGEKKKKGGGAIEIPNTFYEIDKVKPLGPKRGKSFYLNGGEGKVKWEDLLKIMLPA